MKTCTICNVAKPYTEFHRQASRKDGYGNWCKPCKTIKKREEYLVHRPRYLAYHAEYRKANPEKVSEGKRRAYHKNREHYAAYWNERYRANRDDVLAYHAQYRAENQDKIKTRQLKYRQRMRKALNEAQKAYYREHKEERLAYTAQWKRRRWRTDPLFAVAALCRDRIRWALLHKGYPKTCKTAQMIGCDHATLVAHLEAQFRDDMTWDNRGKWEIDHIIPLVSANSEAEMRALCHYTNLQPLWRNDNRSKGAKIDVSTRL